MVYWLVNNNYHLHDVTNHLGSMAGTPQALIRVPHTLDPGAGEGIFTNAVTLQPLRLRSLRQMSPRGLRRTVRETRRLLSPGPADVLILYSEYELRNVEVAAHFRRRGARVFLLDEGIATYFELCFSEGGRVPLIRKALVAYLGIMGIGPVRPTASTTLSKFIAPDTLYSGAFLYQQVPTRRAIRTITVSPELSPLEGLDVQGVVFLNEDIYEFYQPFDEYCRDLRAMLAQMARSFGTVYFKFHPREILQHQDKVAALRDLVIDVGRVHIIEETEPVENLIHRLRVKYVVSYLSVGLMNLFYVGLEPIYVYTLFPSIAGHKDFVYADQFLGRLGYRFVSRIDEIAPGYSCGMRRPEESATIAAWLALRPNGAGTP